MNVENDTNKYTSIVNNYVQNMQPVVSQQSTFIEKCSAPSVRISTGWLSMDIALNGGLANELYIIGAETSTGKSALIMNMAQNIAKQGINVLYFSLEMGTDEFIARAISSLSFVANNSDQNNRRFTAGDILYWFYDAKLNEFTKIPYAAYSKYADEYFSIYGNHLFILEANIDGFCAKDIANIATVFKKNHSEEKTVVFVDYLQIIKADSDDRTQTDRKTKMDISVMTLKTLASQIGMPVITVSSISRSNYNGAITTASFKESGDTEYTGGVLIGWNWHGVTDTSDKEVIEAEKNACAERGYRKMLFDVLKFRNSQRDHAIRLIYYPAFNFLIDEYDWHSDIDATNPFGYWEPEAQDDTTIKDTTISSKLEYTQQKLKF